MAEKIKQHWGILFVAFAVLISLIFWAVSGDHYYTAPHDNLDQLSSMMILKDNDLFFAHGAKAPMLGGLDRDYLYSELKLRSWLYMLLPPLPAYAVCLYIKVLFAVTGWVLLFRQLGFREKNQMNLILVCGLMYGILPVFPDTAIAFGSLPLLLALLLSLYRKPRPWKYLLLFLYPALSDFTLFGIFICGFLLLFCIWLMLKRKPSKHMWAALLVISAGFVVIDYRLMGIMLFNREPTIRDEFAPAYLPLSGVLKESLTALWEGQEHAGALQKYVILPVCIVYFLWLNGSYLYNKQYRKLFRDPFNFLMLWSVFNALVLGLDNYRPLKELIAHLIPPLAGFTLSRTFWFNPFVLSMAFCLVLLRVEKSPRRAAKSFACFLVLLSVMIVPVSEAEYNDICDNLKAAVKGVLHREETAPTFQEFFAEDLFAEVKEDIGYNGENVIAFGFHPSVLICNQFHTLDGYLSYYSLEYKYQFAKLIAPLLEKGGSDADYFTTWGARAYAFSDNVPIHEAKDFPTPPSELLIDPEVFKEMGGKYVLSCLEITNAEELGLTCLGTWGEPDDFYTIRVYVM